MISLKEDAYWLQMTAPSTCLPFRTSCTNLKSAAMSAIMASRPSRRSRIGSVKVARRCMSSFSWTIACLCARGSRLRRRYAHFWHRQVALNLSYAAWRPTRRTSSNRRSRRLAWTHSKPSPYSMTTSKLSSLRQGLTSELLLSFTHSHKSIIKTN